MIGLPGVTQFPCVNEASSFAEAVAEITLSRTLSRQHKLSDRERLTSALILTNVSGPLHLRRGRHDPSRQGRADSTATAFAVQHPSCSIISGRCWRWGEQL